MSPERIQLHAFSFLFSSQVAGSYYNSAKEDDYLRQVRVLEKVHGAAQLARLPPSITHSEGQAFNIVTQDPRDPVKLAAVEGAGNRRFASKKGAMVSFSARFWGMLWSSSFLRCLL
jgi:hypothetical protein